MAFKSWQQAQEVGPAGCVGVWVGLWVWGLFPHLSPSSASVPCGANIASPPPPPPPPPAHGIHPNLAQPAYWGAAQRHVCAH